MEPSLRIMTLALLTVDEREMLSVLALILELKSEAARLRFFVCTVAVDPTSSTSGLCGVVVAAALSLLFGNAEAFMDASSSSSSLRA